MPVHLRTWEAHDATTAALLALEPQRQERRRSECKECGSGPWHMCECGGEHSQTRARFDLARFGERGGDPLALLRGVSVLRVSLFESTWRGLSRYPVGSVATSFEQANLGKKPVAPALLH